MRVRYDDGGAPENNEVLYNIPQGGESRVIDLKGILSISSFHLSGKAMRCTCPANSGTLASSSQAI